jgi:hypothetical protein
MNWSKFQRLVEVTVSRLRSAGGDRGQEEKAIRAYLDQGYKQALSPMVLWDYFAISSRGFPNAPGIAVKLSKR